MEQVKVKWSITKPEGILTISLEDMGFTSQEWQLLDEDKKVYHIQEFLDCECDAPFMSLDSYTED